MTKEDKFGFAGIMLCAALAWMDPWWRWFWIICAVVLCLWTIASLLKRKPF